MYFLLRNFLSAEVSKPSLVVVLNLTLQVNQYRSEVIDRRGRVRAPGITRSIRKSFSIQTLRFSVSTAHVPNQHEGKTRFIHVHCFKLVFILHKLKWRKSFKWIKKLRLHPGLRASQQCSQKRLLRDPGKLLLQRALFIILMRTFSLEN